MSPADYNSKTNPRGYRKFREYQGKVLEAQRQLGLR